MFQDQTNPSSQTDPTGLYQRLDLTRSARPYATWEYIARILWRWVERLLIRPSPVRAWGWRRWWLRRFGARMHDTAGIRPGARIWHPWLFELGAYSNLADGVEIYNLGRVRIGDHTILSQDVYVCAGTHDYRRADLPLIRSTIDIGSGCWVCAGAFIGPDIRVGDNCIIGARAVVMKDVPPAVIAAGNPARVLKHRPPGVIPDEAPRTEGSAAGADGTRPNGR